MTSKGKNQGTVAVLFSSESARFSAFTSDLDALKLPPGSVKDFETGSDANALRNTLVQRALDRGSQWVWFINEEHIFSPEIVMTMLSHQKQITVPVVLSSTAPVRSLAYKGVSRASRPLEVRLDGVLGPGTLLEIDSARTPGMLVRRAVFEALPEPWFSSDADSELLFCENARAASFDSFLDTSSRIGNRIHAEMHPVHRSGRWELSVSVGSEIELSVPIK